MNTIENVIENMESSEDCIKALELIRDTIGSTVEDSHFYADQAILKLLEVLGYQDVVDAYWGSSDNFWYA